MGEETDFHLATTLRNGPLWASSRLNNPNWFTCSRPLARLHCPCFLDMFQHAQNSTSEVQTHQCCFLSLAGHTMSDTSQDALALCFYIQSGTKDACREGKYLHMLGENLIVILRNIYHDYNWYVSPELLGGTKWPSLLSYRLFSSHYVVLGTSEIYSGNRVILNMGRDFSLLHQLLSGKAFIINQNITLGFIVK